MTKLSQWDAAIMALSITNDLEARIVKSICDNESIPFKTIGSDVSKAAKDLLLLVTVLDLYEHEYTHLKKYINNA